MASLKSRLQEFIAADPVEDMGNRNASPYPHALDTLVGKQLVRKDQSPPEEGKEHEHWVREQSLPNNR